MWVCNASETWGCFYVEVCSHCWQWFGVSPVTPVCFKMCFFWLPPWFVQKLQCVLFCGLPQCELGRGSNNQNRNLWLHLPWRGRGSRVPLTYLEKFHFQTNSDFLISMSNCLKHIDCNYVLMIYFLHFSYHSVQSVKHIDCNHVLMRYFLCFWYILFSPLWMPVTQKASKPENPPTMLEVTIYNNIFRSRDSNLDCMMTFEV